MFVAFGIQHAVRVHCIVICGMSGFTIFFHIISNGTISGYWTWHACFDFLYNFCLKHFSLWEELREIWSKMYIGLHVKCPLFVLDFNESLTPILLTWKIGCAPNNASRWQMGFNLAYKWLIFWTHFRKILKYQISWKSVQCEPICFMRTDRHDEAYICFSRFCGLA